MATLSAAVRAETNVPVMDASVEYGLAALGRARLLAGDAPPALGPTRRQLLGGLGAAAIPVVLSLVAPTAAQAQSCSPVGAVCLAGSGDCCNRAGVCLDQATGNPDPCAFTGGPNCVYGFEN